MDQLLFRINRISKKKFRRIRRLSQPPGKASISTQISLWLVAGGVGVYAFGLILPNVVGILVGTPSVVIKGNVIIGNHVSIIRDDSPSMRGTASDLNAQIQKLMASGMTTQVRRAYGFGVSPTGGRRTLLYQIEEALRATPELDTIYAFSDFDITNSSVWRSDREGYARLNTLLTTNRVRLYLGTVRKAPPDPLVVIARESGGGLIDN